MLQIDCGNGDALGDDDGIREMTQTFIIIKATAN